MIRFFSGLVLVLGLTLNHATNAATTPPEFTSPLTVSSAIPKAGQITVFNATATDPQGLPLIFTYDYGDGTVDMHGAHVYTWPGTFTVMVTASNRDVSTTTSLSISIEGFAAPGIAQQTCLPRLANLWIKSQSIKVGAAGKESWHAKFIYNADRTSAGIFNPATDVFIASLGNIPAIQINPTQFIIKGARPKFTFKSAKGTKPSISVTLNERAQTITIRAMAETFTDKVPAVLHNFVKLGGSEFALDIALDSKGKFTANAGYRTAAFVASCSKTMFRLKTKASSRLTSNFDSERSFRIT